MIIIALVFSTAPPINADAAEAKDENDIEIVVMGRLIEFPDQQPTIINSRTMIPVRLAEEFGFDVKWKGETGEVTATDGKNLIVFRIGSDIMTINGISKKMDVKAQIVNGRSMIPLRYLTEPFGYEITYEKNSKTNKISLIRAESQENKDQKKLMKKMGLIDCLYPIYDGVDNSYCLMRIEEAVARGSGQGIKILSVTSNEKDDQIPILNQIASSAKITVSSTLPQQIGGYDIVSINENLWKSYDVNQIAKSNPESLFIVTIDHYKEAAWDQPPIDNSAHFKAVNKLNEPNIITLGRIEDGWFPVNTPYDYAPIPDVFLHNIGNMGQAIATGVFAILLETNLDIRPKEIKEYVGKHSKGGIFIVQPREDFTKRIPKYYKIMDGYLLFESYDTDARILDILNLSSYTGKGVKLALIDHDFDLKGLDNKVKKQHLVSEDKGFSYNNFYGKSPHSHGAEMLRDLVDVVPDAEIHTILIGPWRGTFTGQDAQDIVNALEKAKLLNVDVVSMSFAVWFNKDEKIQKAIKSLADSGIFVSWFWSSQVQENVFRSRGAPIYWEEAEMGPDGVLMYDRFNDEYYKEAYTKFSLSGTAPRLAGIIAQILEVNPELSGKEIKELLAKTGVKVSDDFIQGFNTIPNVERLIRITEKKLTLVQELNNAAPIKLSFSQNYDVMIDGILTKDISTCSLAGRGRFTLQLKKDSKVILHPATQLVSVLLLKDNSGKYYLDSTFNGNLISDIGTIEVKVGINTIEKPIQKISKINIIY